jgi:hypothetical protein
VGAHGQVSVQEVVIGSDSVFTLALGAASSVWVTPRAGIVRAAVPASVNDVGEKLLSLTSLSDLTLTTAPSSLRQLRD